MGFLDSYRRLSRVQRVALGVCGIVVGWYGPSWMSYVFLDPGLFSRRPARKVEADLKTED